VAWRWSTSRIRSSSVSWAAGMPSGRCVMPMAYPKTRTSTRRNRARRTSRTSRGDAQPSRRTFGARHLSGR
jgi:hypothetical protein